MGAGERIVDGQMNFSMVTCHGGFACKVGLGTLDLSPDGRQRRFSYGLSAEPAYFPSSHVPWVIRGLGLIGQGFHRLDGLRQMGGFPEKLRWHTDHFVCWVMGSLRRRFRWLPGSSSAIKL
jgi:hypothetical protein